MAIAAANATFQGQGPVAGGSTVLAFGGSSVQELSYIGSATFTGDAASSTAVLNYIDGTNALSFVPSMIVGARVGGAATASISVVSIVDNADGGKTATVTFSGTVNAATIKVGFMVFK